MLPAGGTLSAVQTLTAAFRRLLTTPPQPLSENEAISMLSTTKTEYFNDAINDVSAALFVHWA